MDNSEDYGSENEKKFASKVYDYNSKFRDMYDRDGAESADEYREDFVEGDMDMMELK